MKRFGFLVTPALVLLAVLAAQAQATIVNIDFNGLRNGDLSSAGTYLGAGAAGGGNTFNGVTVDSTSSPPNTNDNITVTANGLLNDTGGATGIGFTISPVGGDAYPDITGPPPANTSSQALFGDYVFDHSAGNSSDSPFTISGLGTATTADLYFYGSTSGSLSTARLSVVGGTASSYTSFSIFDNTNTLFFHDVPVVAGTITGSLGNGDTGVLNGLTISTAVPEPGSVVLFALGAVGLLVTSRRRKG